MEDVRYMGSFEGCLSKVTQSSRLIDALLFLANTFTPRYGDDSCIWGVMQKGRKRIRINTRKEIHTCTLTYPISYDPAIIYKSSWLEQHDPRFRELFLGNCMVDDVDCGPSFCQPRFSGAKA